jgi:hypothetical protein
MNPMDGNNGLGLGLDFINNVSILVAQLLFGWIGGLGQEEFVGCLGLNRKGIYNWRLKIFAWRERERERERERVIQKRIKW